MIEYNDDEWEEFEEEIVEEQSQGLLSTTRILAALAVLVVVVVVAAKVIAYDPPDLREVPPQLLIGLWTCDDPARSDHYVEFRREFVVFGNGGTGDVKCRVSGLDAEKVGKVDQFTVRYRDMAGIKHRTSMLLDESGTVLRFTNQPSVQWSRVEF